MGISSYCVLYHSFADNSIIYIYKEASPSVQAAGEAKEGGIRPAIQVGRPDGLEVTSNASER